MPNTLLTAQQITRKALSILENDMPFIGSINRQYDSSFGVNGAKIGAQLKVRLPNQYTVRTGRQAQTQATNEQSETLVVADQSGIDCEFYSDELALSLDDFSDRILKPQMSRLASHLESVALGMTLDVANQVGAHGTVPNALLVYLQARQKLNEHLAPNNDRTVLIDSGAMAATVNALSSLFHESRAIAHQYKEGFILRNSGFDFYESQLIKRITHGSADLTTPIVDGAGQGGDGQMLMSGFDALATLAVGQTFTLAGCFEVNPETKDAYSYLKQLVVTAAFAADGAGAGTITFEPKLIATGAYQNCSALPTSGGALVVAGTASTAYPYDLAYQKDAFTFVTANLPIPKGMDMAYQTTKNGLTLRFVRGYDIKEDQFISRFDVLHGQKTLRREHACKIIGA